ncbi:MAG: zinc-dependent metalloprotease [Bacteroidota bacterium]
MKAMALARLRQLSAHEIGHTLGLAHNFAASINNRASVMDYPHPFIQLLADGKLDFSQAYDDKIGEWDKRAILYGYQDFPEGTDETAALRQILDENIAKGLRYISDQDARPLGGAHPYAHLWDNGTDAVAELERILTIRNAALQRFGSNNIAPNHPYANLEEVLVPLYLSHRYQVEAVAKVIGGVNYNYAIRGDGQEIVKIVDAATQEAAIAALLKTLDPALLALPEHILQLIPPKPFGYYRGRESFQTRTGLGFDPISAAESAIHTSIRLLLHPQRAARLVEHQALMPEMPGLGKTIDQLLANTWRPMSGNSYQDEIQRLCGQLSLQHLLGLAIHQEASSQVKAIAILKIGELEQDLQKTLLETKDLNQRAHYTYALQQINWFKQNPAAYKTNTPVNMPDGSPIGSEHQCGFMHHR